MSAQLLVTMVGIERTYRLAGGRLVPVLRGVDLSVAAGEFVALMGPSGSGKSTLLHLVGLLDRPDAGRHDFEGRAVASLRDDERAELRSRRIGFVFQSFHLVPQLLIEDNVGLPLLYQGISRRERHRRAALALERVGLGHRLGHRPLQLSGGEQQRAAIARALVAGPALLAADEPTGALDSVTGAAVMELLGALNREGLAIVMVTHDPGIAARAGRTVHMRDGRVAEAESA